MAFANTTMNGRQHNKGDHQFITDMASGAGILHLEMLARVLELPRRRHVTRNRMVSPVCVF
uniref:Uncharacterized protein n=1 Tax=Oryza brachyantha TaxID=4533 RepID=J3MUK5_ORYBR